MAQYIVDRIEGIYAVCETEEGKMLPVELDMLPKGIKEGDVLSKEANGQFFIDREETQRRRDRIRRLSNSLFKNPKKD